MIVGENRDFEARLGVASHGWAREPKPAPAGSLQPKRGSAAGQTTLSGRKTAATKGASGRCTVEPRVFQGSAPRLPAPDAVIARREAASLRIARRGQAGRPQSVRDSQGPIEGMNVLQIRAKLVETYLRSPLEPLINVAKSPSGTLGTPFCSRKESSRSR